MINYNSVIEALLFSSHHPLKQSLIDKTFPNESINLENRISELNIQYLKEGHAFEICKIAGGYQLVSKKEYDHYIRLIFEKNNEYTLSKPSLDALAIIAYKQPVTRGDIESIRGVSVSTSIMKTLTDRNWVRIIGYREVPGKPAMFATSPEFLDYFGLESLSQLPELPQIKDPRNLVLGLDES